MQVAENIFLLDGAGMDANVYCVDGELLVDAGSGMFLDETLEQMERYNIDRKNVKKILLTHEHFDHMGAAKDMKKKLGAKLLVHEGAKLDGEANLAEFFEEDINPPEVDRRIREGDRIKTATYDFEVLHTPGHSPGSICLWDEERKVLISGDLLFIDGFGRSDIPGGDEEKRNESLKRVKKLDDIEILLPGHGTPGSEKNIYSQDAIDGILAQIE